MKKKFLLLLVFASLVFVPRSRAFSLDDIQVWTGAGTNRAALVIEWNTPEVFNYTTVPAPVANKTLVWGYRFNGTVNGTQMINSIRAADPRLYMVEEVFSFGSYIDAIGYNLNGNGVIGITDGTLTNWITNGLLTSSTVDPDAARPVTASDLFWSGSSGPNWQTWNELGGNGGFNNSPNRGTNAYYDPNTYNHGEWATSSYGPDGLMLTNGSWIGFSISAAGYTTNLNDPAYAAYNNDEQAPPSPDGTYTAYISNTNDFAVQIVSTNKLSSNALYNDPTAVLNRPALRYIDLGIPTRTTIINPPFNVATNGGNVLASISAGGQITVSMGRKVYDDPANPYGVDFIVYGNSFFYKWTGGTASDSTDFNASQFTSNSYFGHAAIVSVSQDGTNWFTYNSVPALFPDNAFRWDEANDSWTEEQFNPTKPLNPSVYTNNLDGQSLAGALNLFGGAAGGTGYDLKASGWPWIQYIRVQAGSGSAVIDSIAAVNPAVVGDSLSIVPDNISAGLTNLVFQKPDGSGQSQIRIQFDSVSAPAKISTVDLSEFSAFAPVTGNLSSAFQIQIKPLAGTNAVNYLSEVALVAGGSYGGNGNDLRVYQWSGTNWASKPFAYNSTAKEVLVNGVTNFSAMVVSQIVPPRLSMQHGTNGLALQFTPVANATHILQRSTNLVTWTAISTNTAAGIVPITLQDAIAPAGRAFYRLLLNP